MEFFVDERRKLPRHVSVPLVDTKDGIRGIPVRVEGVWTAQRHDDVDVFIGEPAFDVAVGHPVEACLAALDPGQQVEGRSRLVTRGQQDVVVDDGAVGRGPHAHLPVVAVHVFLRDDERRITKPRLRGSGARK